MQQNNQQQATEFLTSHPAIDIKLGGEPACLPALFISHGAPNLAIEHNTTTNALARIGQNLPIPKAIIIMSAHWQSPLLELNTNPTPKTWHDYYGFDDGLNNLIYPATGHESLAELLSIQLLNKNIPHTLNPIRDFDHGVWAPLLHLYPNADVPIIQLSLPHKYTAYTCYQLGAIFASLRKEQILIIGSGSITHNLNKIRWDANTQDTAAKGFKTWLIKKLQTDIPTALEWQSYDNIEDIHPSDEHLLPLFFALGAGQRVSVVHESLMHHSLGMDILRFD